MKLLSKHEPKPPDMMRKVTNKPTNKLTDQTTSQHGNCILLLLL